MTHFSLITLLKTAPPDGYILGGLGLGLQPMTLGRDMVQPITDGRSFPGRWSSCRKGFPPKRA